MCDAHKPLAFISSFFKKKNKINIPINVRYLLTLSISNHSLVIRLHQLKKKKTALRCEK